MKRYVLIAGVNGAGKSTLYQSIDELKELKRINTDEIVREIGSWKNMADVVEAGKIAINRINQYFSEGDSFNQETTLCGKSIKNNITRAKSLGYKVELRYVGIDSVELAKQRIAYRVAQGGHDIPAADVERRYIDSLRNLKELWAEFDEVMLYDNTDMFTLFAIYRKGQLISKANILPQWFADLNI